MGDRLRYRLDVDDALRELTLPPLLIQPLIENALKHGIEPKEAGGEITLQVKRRDNQLVIEVADTGCGFTPTASTAGSGTGIANVQARLAALFGSAASLVLEERSPAGVLATLVIPETSS